MDNDDRFSLYVHIPYCRAKCPYCDFNSFAASHWPEEGYVGALCEEMQGYAADSDWTGRGLRSIFIGGGTPSLFSPASIARVVKTALHLWDTPGRPAAADTEGTDTPIEITLEANPGTVDERSLRALRRAGVNRLSLGAQSFHEHHLHTLGRIHSPDDTEKAVHAARAAGYGNLNLDLMFGLPGQSVDEWRSDLRRAMDLQPEHVSAYNLTYEEGTPFHDRKSRGLLEQLPEETELQMFSLARDVLRDSGYEQYEISNYARPGRACVHNLNYWEYGDYLGIGAGAHSFVRRRDEQGTTACRWSNLRGPGAYLGAVAARGHARVAVEQPTARQSRGEFVFLGLRCLQGFEETGFRTCFGSDFVEAFPHAAKLRADGLLRQYAGRWQLSERGLQLADSVFATFL